MNMPKEASINLIGLMFEHTHMHVKAQTIFPARMTCNRIADLAVVWN